MRSLISSRPARSRARLALLPVGLVAVALTLTACSNASSGGGATPTSGTTSSSDSSKTAPTSASAAPSTSSAPKDVVSITTLNNDGAEYGVGMPVIAFFSKKPASAKAWQDDTKVTANGKPLEAAWYFEPSSASTKYPYEAHLRPQVYWPAHASIHVQFPAKGTSLGGDMVTDGKLSSLDFTIGPRNITLVDNSTHKVTVSSDGKVKYVFPTSLGAADTPTKSGIKVIMEKGLDISMRGPGYYDPHVKYTQRLTYGGEYLHAAPWNTYNIEHGINSSNGCTNLENAAAITLYNFLRIGDVVTYPNATGPAMRLGDGYGDWNVTWAQWKTGGAVSTTA